MKQQLKAHEKTHEGEHNNWMGEIRNSRADPQRIDIHAPTLLTKLNLLSINGPYFKHISRMIILQYAHMKNVPDEYSRMPSGSKIISKSTNIAQRIYDSCPRQSRIAMMRRRMNIKEKGRGGDLRHLRMVGKALN